MRSLSAICVLLLALSPSRPVLGWDRQGHETACVKAWTEMNDRARAVVADLLGVSDAKTFAATCTWADEAARAQPDTGAWHFIAIPKTARAIDLTRDCPDARCVVAQIERQRAIVASDAPKAERAEALKYLAHFVADIHQPLHVAFLEDRFGADIRLTFLGREMDMHTLWDGELLTVTHPPSHGYTPFLQEMADRHNRERWTGSTPREWAQETLWIMRAAPTGYVGNPGGLSFGELYIQQNYLVATEQLDKSGVRLGAMLNAIFAAP